MEAQKQNYGLAYSNYNVAFEEFHSSFLHLCETLSETRSIDKIRKNLQAFISNSSYGVEDEIITEELKKRLIDLKLEIDFDARLNKLLDLENPTPEQEAEYLILFYKYYIPHLEILSDFTYNLSVSLMPNTSKQKKLVRFSNNNPFFNRLMEFKRKVSDNICDFNVRSFRRPLNYVYVLFYAYKLFITKEDRDNINIKMEAVRESVTDKKITELIIQYPNVEEKEEELLKRVDRLCFLALLEVNERINKSFGKYGVLPEINKKVEGDRHGI